MNKIRDFGELIARHGGHVTVACDTEFQGPHTISVQFAARLGDDVVVQVYSSPAIPDQPDPEVLRPLLAPELYANGRRVVVRPGRPLPADLSPARVLADLFGIDGVTPTDRVAVAEDERGKPLAPECPGDDWNGELTVDLVGHYWRADFFRVFGRDFLTDLLEYQRRGGQLRIQDRRLLAFREGRGPRPADPVLGYAWQGGGLYAVKVRYFDTGLAFGSRGGLDELAKAFVGVGKVADFGEEEKADMPAAFRRDPVRAYAYAVTDAVLTLLLKEEMEATHALMCAQLGLGSGDTPPLRSTLGSRVSDLVVRSIAQSAVGSKMLAAGRGGAAGPATPAKVRALLEKGSGGFLAREHASQFGEQTGQTHGGLCFSRSPTRFFHEAPGMLADVDLSGCYAGVMRDMRLYAGRPLVYELGSDRMKLRDAVAFATTHAAGPDAWVIKVSGRVTAGPNVLIPSTKGALTNANYKSRTAKRRAAARWAAARGGTARDRPGGVNADTANTAIFTETIEAGVVAWATWLVILALPPAWRKEYEDLEVETILLYPKKMVAGDGPSFDALSAKFLAEGTPWTETVEMGGPDDPIRQLTEWRVDEDYATFGFDLGRLARTLQERREEAKRESGKGSAAERGWKEAVNSLYGVTASPHLPTNNVVAANVITATARALAFAQTLSLNGVQVVTDGCTYRRDQIPAGTLAECLAACPDYPMNRVDFGGPFADPAAVPTDDAGFTAWYRGHVKRFLGVDGPEYDRLFGLHDLEHKTVGDPKRATFDALCCDGSSNYVKLVRADGDADGWAVAGGLKDGFKARSFREEAKEALVEWVIRIYSADRYDGPPPITESGSIMAYKEAGHVARKALRSLDAERARRWLDRPQPPAVVYYPLGVDRRGVKVYKVLKPSGFLFKNPRQYGAWRRAMDKFADATSCGLELLALKRACLEKREGSIADVAGGVYRLIRAGVTNPSKALNLTRACKEFDAVQAGHHQEVVSRKGTVERELIQSLDAGAMEEAATRTGLFVRHDDFPHLF